MSEFWRGKRVLVAGGAGFAGSVLTKLVFAAAGVSPEFRFDPSEPDGQPRRAGDTSLAVSLGFQPKIGHEDDLRRTMEWSRAASIRQLKSISAR